MPRLATSSDLEAVLQLAARKHYPEAPSRDREKSGPAFLSELGPDHDLLVSERERQVTGFLVLQNRWVRGFTGDRDSVVQDSFCASATDHRQLLEMAAEMARGYGSQYLTAEVALGDDDHREVLEALGFGLESHRISVTTGECRLPEESPYAVRPVTPEDGFLIAVLNSTVLPLTLSAGREYDLGELTCRSMDTVMARVASQDSAHAGVVLTLDQKMVGHLLLDLNDRFGYIYDLALEREHWGGTAVRHLMRAGSSFLYRRGLPLFVGDVSAANRRALVVAQRALGFAEESRRYGLKL